MHKLKENNYINIVYNNKPKRFKILKIIFLMNVAVLEPYEKYKILKV